MAAPEHRPRLIYDGECGICIEWVRYWQKLSATGVDFRPYQEVQAEHPEIPLADCKKAIQFIDHRGKHHSGAGAAFAVCKDVPLYRLLDLMYRRLPGFALVSEFFYQLLSRHRAVLSFITHFFWGRNREPSCYRVTSWLFLRMLACIYLAAFASFGVQVLGLVGSEGILPLGDYLLQLQQQLGTSAYWRAPTVFWLGLNDHILRLSCWLGALLACLLFFGIRQRTVLVLLYLLYLSLFYAGQGFMTFQWDLLLLEAGFLAIFLPSGSRLTVWLYRWLVFRFMFLAGMVKILSGDPTWDTLTALHYYFETQPLPTALAWYAHQLPGGVLSSAVVMTLLLELLLPFLIFTPRRLRMAAGCCFILFQSLIILTGNYNFFNLLTIALCLFLFDDAALTAWLPRALIPTRRRSVTAGRARSWGITVVALLLVFSSSEQMSILLGTGQRDSLSPLSRLLLPWHLTQNYGPFAVMTTVRREIVVEGSHDGSTWQEYHFRYKPGDILAAPAWASPHQPRLDWQMWFAALSEPWQNPWLRNLLYRLLSGSQAVSTLLAVNPFAGESPVFVRARFYEYRFSTATEKDASGAWWQRRLLGDYQAALHLSVTAGTGEP